MSSNSKGTTQKDGGVEPLLDTDAREIDVLFGRGLVLLFHPGNVKYRNVVKEHQAAYFAAPRESKKHIAARVVEVIMKTGARFLKRTEEAEGVWMEVSTADVMEKVKQSLREKQKNGNTSSGSGGKRKAQEPLPSPERKPAAATLSEVCRSTPKPENTTRSRSDSATASVGQLTGSIQPPQLTRRSSDPSSFPSPTISGILQSSLAQPVGAPASWLHTNAALPPARNLPPTATVAQLLLQHPSPSASTESLDQILAANIHTATAFRHRYTTSTSASLDLLQHLNSPARAIPPLPTHRLPEATTGSGSFTEQDSACGTSQQELSSEMTTDTVTRAERYTATAGRRLPLSHRTAVRAGAESTEDSQAPLPGIDIQRQRQLQRYLHQDSPLLSSSYLGGSGEQKQSPELFAGRSTATLSPIRRRQQETFQQVLEHLRDDSKDEEDDSGCS